MATVDLLYMFIILTMVLVLVRWTEHKATMALFLFWLMSYPILGKPEYFPRIEALGFDIQPNRFLFFILAPIFLVYVSNKILQQKRTQKLRLTSFEVFLLLYIVIVLISLGLNHSVIGSTTRVIALASNQFVFILLYFTAKQFFSDRDFLVLSSAIIIMAVASSLVGLFQFFIDPEFLRIGDTRVAFSYFLRANGLFSQEYEQGMFQIFALILGLSFRPKWYWFLLLILSSSVAVFFTMHRISWVIYFIILGIYSLYTFRKNWRLLFVILWASILILAILLFIPWGDWIPYNFSEGLLYERIQDDTLTIRIIYYRFSIDMIQRYPLGIGHFFTEFYNQQAFRAGVPFQYLGINNSRALVIHNGILAAGVKHGVLGLLFFAAFLVNLCIYYGKKFSINQAHYIAPLLITLTFLLFNITNDFSDLSTQTGAIFALLIGFFVESRPKPTVQENTAYQPSFSSVTTQASQL